MLLDNMIEDGKAADWLGTAFTAAQVAGSEMETAYRKRGTLTEAQMRKLLDAASSRLAQASEELRRVRESL